ALGAASGVRARSERGGEGRHRVPGVAHLGGELPPLVLGAGTDRRLEGGGLQQPAAGRHGDRGLAGAGRAHRLGGRGRRGPGPGGGPGDERGPDRSTALTGSRGPRRLTTPPAPSVPGECSLACMHGMRCERTGLSRRRNPLKVFDTFRGRALVLLLAYLVRRPELLSADRVRTLTPREVAGADRSLRTWTRGGGAGSFHGQGRTRGALRRPRSGRGSRPCGRGGCGAALTRRRGQMG